MADKDHGDAEDRGELLATCNTCGETIKVKDSAEWPIVQMGALVEFYHCVARGPCRARASRKLDAARSKG